MMTNAATLIAGSVLSAIAIAVLWFQAPLIPALAGAAGAGAALYWRRSRVSQR